MSCIVTLSIVYFSYGVTWAAAERVAPVVLIMVVSAIVLLAEGVRLCCGWIFFAQREHERHQLSSAAMSMLGLAVVLWLAPSASYAYALVITAALVDPWAGEGRRYGLSQRTTYAGSLLLAYLVWGGSGWFWGLSLWAILLAPPLTVVMESVDWRYWDDNFLMLAVPAVLVTVLV